MPWDDMAAAYGAQHLTGHSLMGPCRGICFLLGAYGGDIYPSPMLKRSTYPPRTVDDGPLETNEGPLESWEVPVGPSSGSNCAREPQKGSKGGIYPSKDPFWGALGSPNRFLGVFGPTLAVITSTFLCSMDVQRLFLAVFCCHWPPSRRTAWGTPRQIVKIYIVRSVRDVIFGV